MIVFYKTMSFLNFNTDILTEICNNIRSVTDLSNYLTTCKDFYSILKSSKWPNLQVYIGSAWSLDAVLRNFNYANLSLMFNVSNMIVDITNFRRCHAINLAWCNGVNDSFIEEFIKITPNLQNLNLSHCHIGDKSIKLIGNLTTLYTLDISHCVKISDKSVKYLTNLTNLNLTGCYKVTDSSVETIGKYSKNLKTLSLAMCRGISDRSVKVLGELTTLSSLDISDSRVTDESVKTLTRISSLNLSKCYDVTDDSIREIAVKGNVRNLNINKCHDVLYSVQFLRNITSLDIGGCSEITDESVIILIENNSNLKTLSLSNCYNLTDRSITSISKHASLQVLDLTFCDQITTFPLKI